MKNEIYNNDPSYRDLELERIRVDGWKIRKLGYARNRAARAIKILGGKCVVCGINDHRVLQIDHINGGGVEEVKTIGRYNMVSKILVGETNVYQLLCANCNWIKRWENNETTLIE